MDLMTLANFSHIRQSEISLADLTISTNFRQFLFLHAFLESYYTINCIFFLLYNPRCDVFQKSAEF